MTKETDSSGETDSAGETDVAGDDADRTALRTLLADLDPVPAEVISAAKASLTWRTIDAELAELAFDSLLGDELVGTRGSAETRSVSFEYSSTSIELEIEHTGEQRSVIGQIAPLRPAEMELQRADNSTAIPVAVDDRGRFNLAGLAPGKVRLFARFASGQAPSRLLTEWMTI